MGQMNKFVFHDSVGSCNTTPKALYDGVGLMQSLTNRFECTECWVERYSLGGSQSQRLEGGPGGCLTVASSTQQWSTSGSTDLGTLRSATDGQSQIFRLSMTYLVYIDIHGDMSFLCNFIISRSNK